MPRGSERELTKRIEKMLRRIPNSFCMKLWVSAFTCAGMPDLMFIHNGRSFFFEVKLPRGKVSPLQKQRMEEVKCAGAVVDVVRSVEDVKNALEKAGVTFGNCAECQRR